MDDNKISLKQIHRKEEEERTKEKARKYNLSYVDLSLKPIEVEDVILVPEKKARKGKLAVISKAGKKVIIALNEPGNETAKEVIAEFEKKDFEVKKMLASISSLQKAWKVYEQYSPPEPSLKDVLLIKEQTFEKMKERVEDISDLEAELQECSTSKLLKYTAMGALRSNATDIHIEPEEEKIRIRYRVDGVLQTIANISKDNYRWLLSRVKILSGLKLNVHDINQDGRFSLQIRKGGKKGEAVNKMSVRVSVIPSGQGEAIVMRLLGIGIKRIDMENLGMREPIQSKMKTQLAKPNGMILACGPTSSGKNTTLYSFLKRLNTPQTKIITIEDPIEYNLEGISQTQVNKKEGYTFIKALQAILRQNPDMIMIGEIREPKAAQAALQAATTGHLVFSTLHTNDAAGAITRLKELDVKEKLIPSGVNAVIGQRLVRKLCPHCKKKRPLSKEEKRAMQEAFSLISPESGQEPPEVPDKTYEAQGCPKCMGVGYQGRTGIFEVFTITEAVEELVLSDSTTYQIRSKAMEEGMITLLQDGLIKTVEGETSLKEVKRVAGDARYIESIYGKSITSLLSRALVIEEKTQEKTQKIIPDTKKLEAELRNTKTENLLEGIASAALNLRATDIHVEPKEKEFLIRFRIDGVLQDIARLPKNVFLSVISEIKELSGLKKSVHKKTQEGRFKINWKDKTLDTRISIIPGGYGETTVIRLLRPDVQKIPLEDLGIRKYYQDDLEEELKKPNGIVLACGPTSAGKTTTLYAIMSKLNKPGVKIITIEDPIEYSLEGITQTQVDEEEGYTFAHALRSILRQNPNILMVGEVRDPETAQTAIRASLTGHLVLSTLHTNDASSAFQRLINLQVQPNDIASSCNMIISQRLVRRLCDNCRKSYNPDSKKVKKIKEELKTVPDKLRPDFDNLTLYEAQGCEKCRSSGYKGQTGLFEILFITQKIQKLISSKASTQEIKKAALEAGMLTVRQDGLLKAVGGKTTLEEVNRIS